MGNFIWIVILILGTIVSIGVYSKLDIPYMGCSGMIAIWAGSVFVVGSIVTILGELMGGVFSLIWFLIRLALIIGVIGSIGYYLYNKFKANKE
ncbi:hypothetical protein ACH36K_01505 [Clostridium sp. MB05]|uniref:hypothetical protein n=1 Tax=Clostridium sp. MB05 TaxID=3376682 RepID=UPI0039825228